MPKLSNGIDGDKITLSKRELKEMRQTQINLLWCATRTSDEKIKQLCNDACEGIQHFLKLLDESY